MASGIKPKRIDEGELARVLEAGRRKIYAWAKTRANSWEDAATETRSAYRARMSELLNELAAGGYEVRRS